MDSDDTLDPWSNRNINVRRESTDDTLDMLENIPRSVRPNPDLRREREIKLYFKSIRDYTSSDC